VDVEFLGTLIYSKGRWPGVGSIGLGDDLDRDGLAGYEILGLEDHSKGTMIEGRDYFISSIEHGTFAKLVAHALHGYDFRAIREIASQKGPNKWTRWQEAGEAERNPIIAKRVENAELARSKSRNQTKGRQQSDPKKAMIYCTFR
jgi:hypothetical protein